MALLAAARRASALPLRRGPVLLRHRPTLSSARAISFWSSSSSSSEDPDASILSRWAIVRAQVDTLGAIFQELHLCGALGSAVQSRVARTPAEDLAGLLAQIEATTDYFPFEISENKRADAITLTRALKGEQIKVVVSMPFLDNDHDDDDDDDDDENKRELAYSPSNEKTRQDEEEGEKCASRSTMYLVVSISKGNGSNLEFTCFAGPDKVDICTMQMVPPTTKKGKDDDHDMATYDGFEGLDEDLQKSFHEYLELRGITPKMMNLLRGYLSSKLQHKQTLWLTNLQDFVKERA